MKIKVYKIENSSCKDIGCINISLKEEKFNIIDHFLLDEIIEQDFESLENLQDNLIEILKKYEDYIKKKSNSEMYVFYQVFKITNELKIYVMKDRSDKEINILFTRASILLDNFPENFQDETVSLEYLFLLNCIINGIEIVDSKLEENNLKEICRNIKNNKANNKNKIVKYISKVVLYNSPKWKYIAKTQKYDSEKSIILDLESFIDKEIYKEESYSLPLYYKSVLVNSSHEEFEKMLDIIKNELVNLNTNIIYCEKITDFINNEFFNKGVFITDLFFINQFITNTISTMVLTTTKLYHDKEDIKNRKNCGFNYIKNFINNNLIDDEKIRKSVNCITGGEIRKLVKTTVKMSQGMKCIRDSLVAHFDISNLEEIKKLKVDLETFKQVYENSVKILEEISLFRYHRKSIAYTKMIELHGFENAVCKKMIMYNPNKEFRLDIENYFDYLKKGFM